LRANEKPPLISDHCDGGPAGGWPEFLPTGAAKVNGLSINIFLYHCNYWIFQAVSKIRQVVRKPNRRLKGPMEWVAIAR